MNCTANGSQSADIPQCLLNKPFQLLRVLLQRITTSSKMPACLLILPYFFHDLCYPQTFVVIQSMLMAVNAVQHSEDGKAVSASIPLL